MIRKRGERQRKQERKGDEERKKGQIIRKEERRSRM